MPELAHNMGLLVSLTEAQLRRMDAQLQHQQVRWLLSCCVGHVAVVPSRTAAELSRHVVSYGDDCELSVRTHLLASNSLFDDEFV